MADTKRNNSSKRPMGGGPNGMMRGGEKAKDFKSSMKKLLAFIRPYIIPIIISLVLTIGGTVCVIFNPRLLGDITTEIQVAVMTGSPINLSVIGKIAIIVIILLVLNFVCDAIQGLIMAGITQKISRRLRKEISEKINRLPLKYFDNQSIGDILSRVTNDVDTIAQTLNHSLSSMISNITRLIGILIMMFTISAKLSLISIAVFPISVVLMLVIVKFSQKHFKTQQNTLGAINGYIEEIYSNHNVVKAFNGEEKAIKTFDETNKILYNSAWKSQFFSGLMHPLTTFIANLGFTVVCIVGGIFALSKSMMIGDVQSIVIYVRQLNQPIGQVASIATTLQSTAAAAERVFEFLDAEEQADESHKVSELTNVKGDVEFKNVKFGYKKNKEIIHGFSCNVKSGQKVAIVGPTGSGKTTLVNLLMRFYDANSGDITIDGQSIYDMKREDVRKLFGMVLQDTWLFEGTIRENLVYGKENVTDEQIIEATKSANIHHFIETLPNGYHNMLDNSETLSGGQKQLLTIARAMIQNAPMLILDEATSSVDTRTEVLIQEAMDRLTKGRTSFIIAHRLSTIKNADMILVLKDGDIIEKGTHAELLAQGNFYADLYNSQFSNK